MPAMIITHKVADFATWLKAYEAHAEFRKAAGETKSIVWQDCDDPNTVVVLIKFSEITKAREFMASPDLKAAMAAAGVLSPPTVNYLNDGRKFEN